MSTTPALFAGLLDDAAMFPPGNAAPADALHAHLGYRVRSLSGLIGPLLVPAARFDDFIEAQVAAGSPAIAVSLVGTAERPGGVPPEVEVVGFELPVHALPLPNPGSSFQVACEVTAAPDRAQILAAVVEARAAGRRVIAKYRTGGTSADAFPSSAALADVLLEAALVDAPLKFTAGLHSAVRFTDPVTGFEHHGFLNLMIAVLRARHAEGADAVREALAERNPAAMTGEVNSWTGAEVADIRRAFVSFGCCGVEDPVVDLVKLNLLDLGT